MTLTSLGSDDVDPLQHGASLLGSGGGGDAQLGGLWLAKELADGQRIRMIDADDLAGAWVLTLCAAGSTASVAIEKLPAGDELSRCVAMAENYLGTTMDAIGLLEIGGSNALFPFIAAAQTGKPVVDGDLMGRAFSRLDQTVTARDDLVGAWICAEAHGAAMVVDGVDAHTAERVLRGALTGLGGWAALAYPAISGERYREVVLPGTVTAAVELGRKYQIGADAGDDGAAFAARLGGVFLGQGPVLEVHRYAGRAFASGSVAVQTIDGRHALRIEMQNEYTMVLRDGEITATTPDVICLLDAHTLQAIQTSQVRRGHEVVVLALPVPDRLWQPDILDRFGPRAHGLDADPRRPAR